MDKKSKLVAVGLVASLAVNGCLGYSVYTLNKQLTVMGESRAEQLSELSTLRGEMDSLGKKYSALELKYNTVNGTYGALSNGLSSTVTGDGYDTSGSWVDADGNPTNTPPGGTSSDEVFNGIQDPADLVPPSITDTLTPPVVTPPTVKPPVTPPVTPPTVKPPTVKPPVTPPQKEDNSRPDFGPGWDNLPDKVPGSGLESKPGEDGGNKDGSYGDIGSGGYQ